MKTKIKAIANQLTQTINKNRVEVCLSVIFFILACIYTANESISVLFILPYFPAFFLLANTVNGLTINSRWRFLYYLAGSLFIPFIGRDANFSSTIPITYGVVSLVYLINKKKSDNRGFMEEALLFIKTIAIALVLACVVWLIGLSIYYSIQHIFDIWSYADRVAIEYIMSFSMFLVAPILFLYFSNKSGKVGYSKLFDILVNYILTPALLIYTVLLYVYFIQITINWSLPKGRVALIVIFFASTVYIVKGCQYFVRKRHFDWFYNHAGWAVLPALVMYWIGVGYRISQYGFTEPRVYLLIIGIILTITAILFFSRRYGRYIYIASLTVFLFSIVTYIPGITAEDLELYSQNYREKHGLIKPSTPEEEYFSLYIEYDKSFDITGYKNLYSISYSEDTVGVWMNFVSHEPADSIFLYKGKDQLLFSDDAQSLFEKQMRKLGLVDYKEIPESAYPGLLRVDMESGTLIFRNIYLTNTQNGDSLDVRCNWVPMYFLEK